MVRFRLVLDSKELTAQNAKITDDLLTVMNAVKIRAIRTRKKRRRWTHEAISAERRICQRCQRGKGCGFVIEWFMMWWLGMGDWRKQSRLTLEPVLQWMPWNSLRSEWGYEEKWLLCNIIRRTWQMTLSFERGSATGITCRGETKHSTYGYTPAQRNPYPM